MQTDYFGQPFMGARVDRPQKHSSLCVWWCLRAGSSTVYQWVIAILEALGAGLIDTKKWVARSLVFDTWTWKTGPLFLLWETAWHNINYWSVIFGKILSSLSRVPWYEGEQAALAIWTVLLHAWSVLSTTRSTGGWFWRERVALPGKFKGKRQQKIFWGSDRLSIPGMVQETWGEQDSAPYLRKHPRLSAPLKFHDFFLWFEATTILLWWLVSFSHSLKPQMIHWFWSPT